MQYTKGLGLSQQTFCNAKMAFVYTAAGSPSLSPPIWRWTRSGTHRILLTPASTTACWRCAFLFSALGSASGRRTHRKSWNGWKNWLVKFERKFDKIAGTRCSATRKWSCLLKKYPAIEKDIFSASACTSNSDEWSALAGFWPIWSKNMRKF